MDLPIKFSCRRLRLAFLDLDFPLAPAPSRPLFHHRLRRENVEVSVLFRTVGRGGHLRVGKGTVRDAAA